MTKSTHTPGPWIYHSTAGDHDFAVYPEATGRDVALVRDFNEANAALIAAAPDLLAACQALAHYGTKGKMPDGTWAFDLLAPAIAKATGGQS